MVEGEVIPSVADIDLVHLRLRPVLRAFGAVRSRAAYLRRVADRHGDERGQQLAAAFDAGGGVPGPDPN